MNFAEQKTEYKLGRLFKIAIVAGVESAVKLHIDRGDALNSRDERGLTPLMIAAGLGRASICKLLLSAGADSTILDPRGRDALAIAKERGASDVIALLTLKLPDHSPKRCSTPGDVRGDSSLGQNSLNWPTAQPREPSANLDPPCSPHLATRSEACIQSEHSHATNAIDAFSNSGADEANIDGVGSSSNELDWDEFDLHGWAAEIDAPPPEDDRSITSDAEAIRSAMSEHKTIDAFASWADLDVDLPESARALRIAEGDLRSMRLQSLLRRGLRDGSVPEHIFLEACDQEDGTLDSSFEGVVRVAFADIGVQLDERIALDPVDSTEFSNLSTSFEDELNEVLDFVEDLSGGRNSPIRGYVRDVGSARHGSSRLLTAEQEIALGREMEESIGSALDALADWPSGIANLLLAAERIRTGEIHFDMEEETSDLDSNTLSNQSIGDCLVEDSAAADDLDSDESSSIAKLKFESSLTAIANAFDEYRGHPRMGIVMRESLRQALLPIPLLQSILGDTNSAQSSEPAELFASSMKRYSQAKERMIVSNLRLAMSIAKRYNGQGLPYEDLVQEGNIGLVKAVDRYKWRLGFRFSTYATWWIRQSITRAIADTGFTIRIPVHRRESLNRVRRISDEKEQATGKKASPSDIARLLSTSIEKASEWVQIAAGPSSLDELLVGDEESLSDFIRDESAEKALLKIDLVHLRRVLDSMLDELDAKQATVIRLRNGWDDGAPKTLDEVGKAFGVTRERIRQIEAKAMRKLTHPHRQQLLAAWSRKASSATRPSFAKSPVEESATSSPQTFHAACTRSIDDLSSPEDCGQDASDEPQRPEETNPESEGNVPPLPTITPPPKTDALTSPQVNPDSSNNEPDRDLRIGMRLAEAHGLAIVDERVEGVGRVWVTADEIFGAKNRKLARTLIALGFQHMPGKGFWR